MKIVVEIGLFAVAMACSILFSMVEHAFLLLRRERVVEVLKAGGLSADRLRAWIRSPAVILGGVVFLRALANAWIVVAAMRFFSFLLPGRLGAATALTLALVAFLLLTFSSLVPKGLVRERAVGVVAASVPWLRVLSAVLYPVTKLSFLLVDGTLRALGARACIEEPYVTEEEIETLIQLEEKKASLEEEERRMIRSIYEFSDTVVREVMVPRLDIVAIPEDATLRAAAALVREEGFSRIPVYRENLDSIVGILYAKDLVTLLDTDPADLNRPVGGLMHEPSFVPETKDVGDLLREFQEHKVHISIVVDEYGGTSGLVTIEDIIEEIVGEIRDEYDEVEPPPYREIAPGQYEVDARMAVEDLAHSVGLELPEGEEYETVGGLIFCHLGRVPREGERVEVDGIMLTVLDADEKRVIRVRLAPSAGREGA